MDNGILIRSCHYAYVSIVIICKCPSTIATILVKTQGPMLVEGNSFELTVAVVVVVKYEKYLYILT